MADTSGETESVVESVMDKITDGVHPSPSDSHYDDDKPSPFAAAKSKIYRLFGRERPLHNLLGGGKAADIFLWRDKKITAGLLAVATVFWALFELIEYHLLTLVCHIQIVALVIIFLWSNVTTYINKTPPKIPELEISKDTAIGIASAIRVEINKALAVLRNIASGRDTKIFLLVIATLWVLSVVGSWCNFLTLFYISFVLLHTVPVLYEKYEDKVDRFAEKAEREMKKHYAVFNAKVLSKIRFEQIKGKIA